ncbi:hypothetical protein RM96_35730 [Cupriavidus sp. IDO]|nr:hypothetical protein RM96_35730 [Cupriavidus sp. IDO]
MNACLRVGSVTELSGQALPVRTWMSEAELARLAAMQSAQRAAQFVAGRWLARVLLADAFGGARQDWTLSDGADAPPEVCGPAPAFLSLSHTGDRIACAVSDQPIGIDLERCRPRKGLDDLMRAITTEAERARLATANPLQAFAEVWTLKEAWLKRRGGGLFATMLGHAVAVHPAARPDEADACTWSTDDLVLALCADELAAVTARGMQAPCYWRMVPAGTAPLE